MYTSPNVVSLTPAEFAALRRCQSLNPSTPRVNRPVVASKARN